jgi:hypothetical protein
MLERPELSLRERLGLAKPQTAYRISRVVLQTAARVNRFEDKAGFSTRQIDADDDTATVDPRDIIPQSDVIDLTDRLAADGTLRWTPPAGRWVVLRFGYSLIGRTNHPASSEATGLEVDKLSHRYVAAYVDKYLGELGKALGRDLIGQHGLSYLVMDSYEVGAQNWTDDMLDQFRRRRGYSAVPWLPVLAGRVVGSAQMSDRFLWDFRKTIADLMADSYYGQIAASLRGRDLGLYAESHEYGRDLIADGMQVKKSAAIPMGAAWASRVPGRSAENYDTDIRESASVAHIYGKKLVAAESFTALGGTYEFDPARLKPIADRELAMGVNRFVISASAHQPDSRPGPGIALGPFGIWFTRHETWAEHAGAWVSYLARSSYLMQQGRFVADIAYLYGEDTNLTSLFGASAPAIPSGYNFDYLNADALLNELAAEDGRLMTRSGMSYRLLALDPSTKRMSVAVLRKIRDVSRAGVLIAGPVPTGVPSLANNEDEFRRLVAEVWPDGREKSLEEALASGPVEPDLVFTPGVHAELRFIHRTLPDGEIYFISNGADHILQVEASFRVRGKAPELWRADAGTISPLAFRTENNRTVVPLTLDRDDAVFVIFRQPTTNKSRQVESPASQVMAVIDGPWIVRFPPRLGAPASAQFSRLSSWTENADAGIRYFSGTATYYKTVPIPAAWLGGTYRLMLDLGEVRNLAAVRVNGRPLGDLWKAPYRVDITDALKPGNNRVAIQITNLWPNRLIGDHQPGAERIAFAAYDPFKADSPLLPSGLLGPVTVVRNK